MIKVLMADDHPPIRAGIREALNRDPDIEVVAEVADGRALLSALNLMPDVLLLDIYMPDFDAHTAVPRLRAKFPDIKIVIVTAHDDEANFQRLVKDVDGYLLKDEDLAVYARAVHDVYAGRTYYSQRVMTIALNGSEVPRLTDRELEVLEMAARGIKSPEIGNRLYISPRTVDAHIASACQKLEAPSRTAAVAKAMELHLISPKSQEER